jgi:hypothetical protein
MQTSLVRKRSTLGRRLSWLVVAAMTAAALAGPSSSAVSAATPTDATTSNLQGIASSYTSVLIDGAGGTSQDTVLYCNANTAVQFISHINFHLSQAAPAGSFFRVYLTPNGGANLTPAGVDITKNQGIVSTAGLAAGDYNLPISLNVSESFNITSGGVLLVIADDVSGAKFNSKSNSLNCTEATPTPTPTPEATPTPTPEATPTPTPEATPTPTPEATPTPTPEATPTPTPDATPTPTPTPDATPTPTPTPEQPTPTPTPVPSTDPTPVPTPESTPTPTGSVLSEVGAPRITLPPTDTLSEGTETPSGDNWRLILLAMAGILATTLILTPAASPARRRNR